MDKSAVIKQVLSPRVSASVSLILLLLLMMVLASVFWSAAAFSRDVTLPVSRPVAAVAQSAGGPQYNVQSLLAVPLFGEAPQDDSEKVIQQDVQRSRLKISVLGLVSGSDESGVAILRHGSKTKAYSVGEKIEVAGSVTLLAVMSDHIIIENNRRQEKIELEKRQLSGGITAAPSASAQPADDEVISLDRPEIKELIGEDPMDTGQNSPLKLVRFFSASPVTENGQVKGYALSPGRDPRLFKLLGIEPGDVVLSVNGQSLADLPATELMKLMENTQSFELLVQRNDSILSKRLDL